MCFYFQKTATLFSLVDQSGQAVEIKLRKATLYGPIITKEWKFINGPQTDLIMLTNIKTVFDFLSMVRWIISFVQPQRPSSARKL